MLIPNAPMHEKAYKWFLNYCQFLEENNKQREEIISDANYTECLLIALRNNKELRTPKIDLQTPLVKEIGSSHKIALLYGIIRDYANKKYIVSLLDEEGLSYLVKIDDVVIKIGFDNKNTKTFFARIVTRKIAEENIILFSDVQKDLVDSKYSTVKQELVGLQNYIHTLKSSGISDDDIIYTVAKELKYVR